MSTWDITDVTSMNEEITDRQSLPGKPKGVASLRRVAMVVALASASSTTVLNAPFAPNAGTPNHLTIFRQTLTPRPHKRTVSARTVREEWAPDRLAGMSTGRLGRVATSLFRSVDIDCDQDVDFELG